MRTRLLLSAGLLTVAVLPLVVAPEASGVVMCDGQPATIVGTPGVDMIEGDNGPDVIAGLGGDDIIRGYGGADRICGGAGDDIIAGGGGDDRIRGNAGDDALYGGADFDTIWGGWGNDLILPGGGTSNVVYGGAGRDQIVLEHLKPGDDYWVDGRAGRDTLDLRPVLPLPPDRGTARVELEGPITPGRIAADGDWSVLDYWTEVGSVVDVEKVFGTDGNDYLIGDGRPNRLRGMRGDDRLYGMEADDRLLGGFGSDFLQGWYGDDLLRGGPGDDYLWGYLGYDRIFGGGGYDACDGEALVGCEAVP